ncbi:MAG TPA: Ig domain-containing protein [Solirubrobacteraceae bacterium]|nr:Ig domain-containing protein [Solirubrobacteraceae bacterium]
MGANDVNGTWTSEGITLPSGAEYVRLYVSCPTSGSCGASGFYYESFPTSQAIAASYVNGKWSSNVQLIASQAGDEYPYLDAPSCPASGSCVAVGGVYMSAEKEYEPLVASASAGVWGSGATISLPSEALTEAEAQTLKDERDGELYSVSCWAVGVCEAVGGFVNQKGEFAPMVVSETGGVWGQAEEIAQPGNAATNNGEAWLEEVSCTASGVCGAAGSYDDAAGELRGMAASAGSALSVTSSSLPTGQVGTPYTAQLAASGGLGSYTWSVASGSLPAGLTLNAATGAISGTPTGAGASFTVSVANVGPPAQTAQRTLSM